MNSRPWMAAAVIALCAAGVFAQDAQHAQRQPTTQTRSDPFAALRDGLALQMALDRAGFSPGLIDGRPGSKTAIAIREFQLASGLPANGVADEATRSALKVEPALAICAYAVTADDAAQVGHLPTKWADKAKAARLPYPSIDEMLAEKFHCSRALLATLNGGTSIAGLTPGNRIIVPNVPEMPSYSGVAKIEVNLSTKIIRLLAADGKTRGLLHCSVAAHKSDLPSGKTRVVVIKKDPAYAFDPAKWPEVKGITQTLLIPPGPRNPVGLCWIGLGLKGYGIHGTPAPEMIGKTGSHGCVRLTNWDALRLGRSISEGTPVEFVGGPTRVAASDAPPPEPQHPVFIDLSR